MTTANASSYALPEPAPGPTGMPLLGNLPDFAADPLAFLTRLRDDHGDVVAWRLGGRPCLFLARPEHIAEVLAGAETVFRKTELGSAFRQVFGAGLVTSEGAEWQRRRAAVQPAVRPRHVKSYARTMIDCAEEFVSDRRSCERVDVRREMMTLTQRIAVRTIFGIDSTGREAAIGRAMDIAQEELGASLRGLGGRLPAWIPTPGRRRLAAAVEEIDTEVGRVVKERRRAHEERDDLVSRLMAASDEQGRSLTDREIRDEAVTLYVGGHETTGMLLTWAWYLLSRNPEARGRLTAELDDVIGQGRAPSYDDYEQLRYTRQIVKETLRLYPPVWLTRVVAREGSVLAGRSIPEGTMLWTSQWATHRDPRWFPDPAEFRPERWNDEVATGIPEHAWYPFGGGPRACIGARFAQVEAALVLATVARRCHFDIDSGDIAPKAELMLRPDRDVMATVRLV
ncbi:cytochrome P450 [Streptomyces sp. NPDC056632]|uniref:cytochrome P450 n=1 Tax=Streptomyces sp. NPDC056632 TaxID=3345884 RepID=UPI00369E93A0